jgi:hypothetical protein
LPATANSSAYVFILPTYSSMLMVPFFVVCDALVCDAQSSSSAFQRDAEVSQWEICFIISLESELTM